MNKTCFIFNYASHYRDNIYRLIDKSLDCEIYHGDSLPEPIKEMNLTNLTNKWHKVKNIWLGRWFIQHGVIHLAFRKDINIYILHGDLRCLSSWVLLFFTKLLPKKKAYLWTHGWYGKESQIEILVKKIFYSLCSGFLLYGERARELMIAKGYKEAKLNVIYNSLDYDKQLVIRKKIAKSNIYQRRFKNTYPTLLFIGRLTPIKRIDLILTAISMLKLQNKYFNFTVIGDGEMKDHLLELAKKYNIENQVWFYGSCYDEITNAELIYNADLCVSPGNVGLTAIHCLSYGTPVITNSNFSTQMPESEAIHEGESGIFFEENNLIDLINKISQWQTLANTLGREKIRRNCFSIIDNKYNPHRQLETLNSVIADANAITNK